MQLVRHYEHVERSYFKVETYAYRGPAIFDGKGYRKLDVEDEEDRAFKGSYHRRLDGGAAASLRRCGRAAAAKRVRLSAQPQRAQRLHACPIADR